MMENGKFPIQWDTFSALHLNFGITFREKKKSNKKGRFKQNDFLAALWMIKKVKLQ